MNTKLKKQIRIYSILFLISIFLTFLFKYIKLPNFFTLALSIYIICLILFGTVLLISKTKKENFEIVAIIITIIINVLNFINNINLINLANLWIISPYSQFNHSFGYLFFTKGG